MFNAIKRMFVRENSVKGASIILIITLALSNLLGVFRDHFLAQKIPTDRLDIYFAAFRLPDLIFNILILGSVAAAFVPVYSKYLKEKGQKEAQELAQASITVGLVAVAICLAVLYFLMPYLIHGLVPSFSLDKKAETVTLARWLLLSPLFFTVSYFLGGILNSHKRFLTYSIAPLIYNFAIIVSVLLFADRLGVKGVVFGVIAGAALHMLVQLPTAIKIGFVPNLRFDFKNPGVLRIIRLMVPRAIGLGANQILLVAYTVMASAFPGAIAIYNFTDNIQTVPSVIFGTSFATAVFPTLAGLSITHKNEKEQFQAFFIKTARAVLFFMLPATAMVIILRAQIIRLILGYGFFGWSDTRIASATLGFFALSIIAQGLIPLFARSFYALHDTRTPMISSIISIVVSIVLGIVLIKSPFGETNGVASLALAFSIGTWLNFIILLLLIAKKVQIDIVRQFGFIFKVIGLTVFMVLAIQLTKILIADLYDIDRVRFLALQTVLAVVVGGLVYLGGAWVLKFKEIRS